MHRVNVTCMRGQGLRRTLPANWSLQCVLIDENCQEKKKIKSRFVEKPLKWGELTHWCARRASVTHAELLRMQAC